MEINQLPKNLKENLLQLITSKPGEAVVITDAEGYITWVNKEFTTMTGYEAEKVLNFKPGDILQGKETDPEQVKDISQKIKDNIPFKDIVINYRKDGTKFWMEMDVIPIFDDQGEKINYISFERDVTKILKRDKLIQELNLRVKKQSTALAVQNDRILKYSRNIKNNRELFNSKIMDMIIHDLKTPLATLKHSLLQNHKHKETELKIVDDALYLIENILNWQKINNSENNMVLMLGSYNLAGLIQEAILINEFPRRNKNINIQSNIDSNIDIKTDKLLMARVITNIINNAIKYSDPKSEILITNQFIDEHKLVITIQDQGQGISKQQLEKIFDLYYSGIGSDLKITSHGLGLNFCKLALSKLGGEIDIESELNQGTKVKISVPEYEIIDLTLADVNFDSKEKTTPSYKLVLNSFEKQRLASYLAEIKKFKIYEAGDILLLLNSISLEDEDYNLREWVKSVRSVVLNNDSSDFEYLLNIAS